MMGVLKEAAMMVVGMAEYYSSKKLDLEAIEEVLKPFFEGIEKDGEGYLAIKRENERRRQEEAENEE